MCIFYLEALLVRIYSLNYQPLIKQMKSDNIVGLVVNFILHFKASLSATELETAVCLLQWDGRGRHDGMGGSRHVCFRCASGLATHENPYTGCACFHVAIAPRAVSHLRSR